MRSLVKALLSLRKVSWGTGFQEGLQVGSHPEAFATVHSLKTFSFPFPSGHTLELIPFGQANPHSVNLRILEYINQNTYQFIIYQYDWALSVHKTTWEKNFMKMLCGEHVMKTSQIGHTTLRILDPKLCEMDGVLLHYGGLCLPALWLVFSLAAWHGLGRAVIASATVSLLSLLIKFLCWLIFLSLDVLLTLIRWLQIFRAWKPFCVFIKVTLHSSPFVHHRVILCLTLRE